MGEGNLVTDKKRILIVEDNVATITVLREALLTESYIVETAVSASQALGLISNFQPHLVITDNDMDEMSGLEMLKLLRAQQNYVTVIFVSGRTDSPFVSEALRAGADDYIRKPFRIDEFLARVAVALRVNDVHKDLLAANQRLKEMVEHDELTGLFNMRSMYDRIDIEIKRAQRFGRKVACVMLDMDRFKAVNDQHDHLFGSFVLREVGQLIKKNMREVDFAARYGGDEFLIVLTETSLDGAKNFSERMRRAVESHEFVLNADCIRLTCSLGYALGGAGDGRDARNMVREADHALYKAKNTGRNRALSEG